MSESLTATASWAPVRNPVLDWCRHTTPQSRLNSMSLKRRARSFTGSQQRMKPQGNQCGHRDIAGTDCLGNEGLGQFVLSAAGRARAIQPGASF